MFTPFRYSDKNPPEEYKCRDCNITGVRLYREYQTFLEHQILRCRKCAIKNQDEQPAQPKEHEIGWLVAAVPTEEGDAFWGYSSVPLEGVKWWDNLPKE